MTPGTKLSTSYVPYHPEQQLLLPPALQDWLPQGHLAYFISDIVDSLNLNAFHPAMMVTVWVCAYATGVFSSRKIAGKLHEDVAFRVLGADSFPAHRTIRDVRALHLAKFTELFVQVVRLAREMGLVKLGTIAVDDTKVKANARPKACCSSHHWVLETVAPMPAQACSPPSAMSSKPTATRNALRGRTSTVSSGATI